MVDDGVFVGIVVVVVAVVNPSPPIVVGVSLPVVVLVVDVVVVVVNIGIRILPEDGVLMTISFRPTSFLTIFLLLPVMVFVDVVTSDWSFWELVVDAATAAAVVVVSDAVVDGIVVDPIFWLVGADVDIDVDDCPFTKSSKDRDVVGYPLIDIADAVPVGETAFDDSDTVVVPVVVVSESDDGFAVVSTLTSTSCCDCCSVETLIGPTVGSRSL